MHEINFIKGKGLITKNIENSCVWWYFEIPVSLYEKIHNYLNKPLTLSVSLNWITNEFNCNIDNDTTWYISFIEDHWVLKLNIVVPDILLAGTIIKWILKLKLD